MRACSMPPRDIPFTPFMDSSPPYRTLRADLMEGGGVLRLVLGRAKGNVLTCEMMAEISAALDDHLDRPELRLILLRGAGGNFSFGASIEEHRKEQAPALLSGFHRLVRRLAASPVPVAALIEGQCLGGGFELVLVAHFLFATPNARLGCPEIKLGVFPPVVAAVGASRLGAFLAERMLLTGESIGAAEADRAGLLTRLVDGDGDPEESVLAWYRETLAHRSAFTLRQAATAVRETSGFLEALDRALAQAEERYLTDILESHDGNEGIEAFLAHRAPAWHHR